MATEMVGIIAMARAAGVAGRDWDEWTSSDELQLAICALGRFDTADIEKAFVAGRMEYRVATWRVAWTTAPADYDTFGTETVGGGGNWYGKTLRQVVIEPEHYVYQTSRYSSGLHPSWDVDPRIEEARANERMERERVERAAYEEKRAAGLVWLTTATPDELEDFDAIDAHAIRHDEVRAERKRRDDETTEEARLASWKVCLAIVPEGVTLIDPGEPSKRGKYGVIPGRSPRVYYNVRIVHAWPDDTDQANVMGEGNDNAGSIALVADWIAGGRLRVATPKDNVPPFGVLSRLGHEQILNIRRVEVGTKTVWVGRPTFGTTLVLDERGHIVRAKKIVEAALSSRKENESC